MPEASTTEERGSSIKSNESKNTFNRAIHDAEVQSAGMVFLPSRKIKCAQAGEGCDNSVPAITKVEGAGKDSDTKGSVDGVDTVIEKFSEGTGLASAASLAAIAGIESLVEEETD